MKKAFEFFSLGILIGFVLALLSVLMQTLDTFTIIFSLACMGFVAVSIILFLLIKNRFDKDDEKLKNYGNKTRIN